MVLSMVDVAGLAYDAGLRNPAKIAQAVAIASAESGRDPARLGDTGRAGERTADGRHWGPSVGLWQIRSITEERGKGTTRDGDALKNPAHNAKAMVEISGSGGNWSPWSVTSPLDVIGFARYRAALPVAVQSTSAALAKKGTEAAGDKAEEAAGAVLEPVEQLAGTISDAMQTPVRVVNWFTEAGTWVRVAYFAGGGLLLVLALAQVVKGPALTAAGKVVQTVIPAGKAAKIVKGIT